MRTTAKRARIQNSENKIDFFAREYLTKGKNVMFVYLFEAKSIQSYLFQSGKLKDVISASERIDRLIDSKDNSTLAQVIKAANLETDLLTPCNAESAIHFLRCKGGAFYCYCIHREPLLALRSLWTLTIEQAFPSLQFTDALTEADNLASALEAAHKNLACERNTPTVKLPIASAPTHRYSRTGNASVPLSSLAKKATHKDELSDFDIDTELHRQAYQAFDMRKAAALQDKFTPDELKGLLSYPIDLENDFLFSELSTDLSRSEREAVKDIALIHIDGNGLGILLMALKNALKDKNTEEFCQGFRTFSDALNTATTKAAKKATRFVYDAAKYTVNADSSDTHFMIPMRPIVLGGDDITLLCRADLALEYSQIFCREFKLESELAMEKLFTEFLNQSNQDTDSKNNSQIKPYLTASGGILYHKAGHPFTHSHHLVEDLCAHAKKLTKSVNNSEKEVGPAALAFHRLSNTVNDSFDDVLNGSLTLGNHDQLIQIGRAAYFVDERISTSSPFDLAKLFKLMTFCTQKNTPVPISRWRQIATSIAMGDIKEADRIFDRGRSLSDNRLCSQLDDLLADLMPQDCDRKKWFWVDKKTKKCHSMINDLLIIHHFQRHTHADDSIETQEETVNA